MRKFGIFLLWLVLLSSGGVHAQAITSVPWWSASPYGGEAPFSSGSSACQAYFDGYVATMPLWQRALISNAGYRHHATRSYCCYDYDGTECATGPTMAGHCERGYAFDHVLQTCVSACHPQLIWPRPDIGSYSCVSSCKPYGQVQVKPGLCGSVCPSGQLADSSGICQCPDGTTRNESTGECTPTCSPPRDAWSPALGRCLLCAYQGPSGGDPIMKVTKAGYVCQYNGATNGYTPVGQLSNGTGQTTMQSFVYPGQGGGYQAIPPQGVNSSVCAGF